MALDGAVCLLLGGDPELPAAPGQGWGCDKWGSLHPVVSPEPGCLTSPPPESTEVKRTRSFITFRQLLVCIYNSHFSERFFSARRHTGPFLCVFSGVKTGFLTKCGPYDLNV